MDHVTRKVQEARKQRDQLLRQHASENARIKTASGSDRNTDRNPDRDASRDTSRGNARRPVEAENTAASNTRKALVATCLLAVVAACIFSGWVLLGRQSAQLQQTAVSLPLPESERASATSGSEPVNVTIAEQELQLRLSELVNQVAQLTESVTDLGDKLERANELADSMADAENQRVVETALPLQVSAAEDSSTMTIRPAESALAPDDSSDTEAPVLAQGTETRSTVQFEPGETQATADERVIDPTLNSGPDAYPQQPVLDEEKAVNEGSRNRPWVVNLLSSTDKADADRFEKQVEAAGTVVEQQEVTIKGTTYWRVQVVGFTSLTDAKAYAEQVSAQFALKDAWVMKRQADD